MRDQRHAQATASPPPEPADAPEDHIAAVVSLDTWRLRASATPATTPQARADARAAHPAHLWASIRAATPS
ncbi:MAG: hypothetical protein QOD63_2761 [Actinomycetota bacterium]|jgi:hypothetical protein|nr:hypothetical protein [Actinomycetota bacterium]